MIQNLNNFSYQYQGEEYAFSFSMGEEELYLLFDGQNKLYQCAFKANQEQSKIALELICTFAKDQSFDLLSSSFNIQFFNWLREDKGKKEWGENNSLVLNRNLLFFKTALKKYKGEDLDLSLSADEIICRCNGVDKKEINHLFELYQGKKKTILNKSFCSLICGSCSPQVDLEINFLWERRLQKVMDDFALFSPMEFTGLDLRIFSVEVNAHLMKIIFHLNETKEDIKKLEEILSNYLSAEINGEFEILLEQV